jgi:hypothetical protein
MALLFTDCKQDATLQAVLSAGGCATIGPAEVTSTEPRLKLGPRLHRCFNVHTCAAGWRISAHDDPPTGKAAFSLIWTSPVL